MKKFKSNIAIVLSNFILLFPLNEPENFIQKLISVFQNLYSCSKTEKDFVPDLTNIIKIAIKNDYDSIIKNVREATFSESYTNELLKEKNINDVEIGPYELKNICKKLIKQLYIEKNDEINSIYSDGFNDS
jgi:hypothetical protein